MPPVRLLALTVCGCLTSALRKPLRPQPHCYHHHRVSTYYRDARYTTSAAFRSFHLDSMATSASSHGEGLGAGMTPPPIRNSGSGSGSEGSFALGLDTAAGVYRYLHGRWELEKTIDYKAGGMAGTWIGFATFAPDQQEQQEACNNHISSARREEGASGCDQNSISNDSATPFLLRYIEKGTFRVDGKGAGFEAGQRLVYDCSGPVVRVHFVDDPKKPEALRFFHELSFRAAGSSSDETTVHQRETGKGREASETLGTAAAPLLPRAEFEHLCVRDMYRGQVEVVGPNEFKTRWHVTGPQKDGRIHATFKRR